MKQICERVYKNFVNHVMKKDIQIDTPYDVLKSLVYIVEGFNNLTGEEKKTIVIQTLQDITAGDDGVLGSDDDLIPRHVMDGLELLIRSNMISSTIDLVCEATLAKTGMTITCYFYKILTFLFCCCRPRPKQEKKLKHIIINKTKTFNYRLPISTPPPLLSITQSVPIKLQIPFKNDTIKDELKVPLLTTSKSI